MVHLNFQELAHARSHEMPWQDHPQSKENAERVGKDACSDYVNAVSKRWVGFATDSGLYIVAEFSNVADGMLADNLFDLPRTIGKDLENSGYTGDLIIKTRWEHPTTHRTRRFSTIQTDRSPIYRVPLPRTASGLRTETETGILINTNYHFMGSFGQTSQRRFWTVPAMEDLNSETLRL